MRLFLAKSYAPIDPINEIYIKTPLGAIERRYTTNATFDVLNSERLYRHNMGVGLISKREASGYLMEEMVTVVATGNLGGSSNVSVSGVLVRVEATAQIPNFHAEIKWVPGFLWTEGCGEPGEGVEARSWVNQAWNVTVGTEDSEYLLGRSCTAKWMPKRLATYFENNAAGTVRVKQESISILLPALNSGERFQLQFVVASGPRDDPNIWLNIDLSPELLLASGDCE